MEYVLITAADSVVYKKGDRLIVEYQGEYFAGVVTTIREGQIHLRFDDGDSGKVSIGSKRILGRANTRSIKKAMTLEEAKKYLANKPTAPSSANKRNKRQERNTSSPETHTALPKRLYLGYWKTREKAKSKMPWPIIDESGSKSGYINWIRSLIKGETPELYKGFSKCRICDKENGNGEYKVYLKVGDQGSFLCIPTGYLHYIRNHHVAPFSAFYNAVKKGNVEELMKHVAKNEDGDYCVTY